LLGKTRSFNPEPAATVTIAKRDHRRRLRIK